MESESNLKHLFGEPQKPNQIDLDAVVRRSRARRVPRIAGIATVGVLAIGGFGYLGVTGLGSLGTTSAADSAAPMSEYSSQESAGAAASDEIKRAPAEKINLCTGPVAEGVVSQSGLVFAVDFPDAAVGSVVDGTVTLTNTSDVVVNGSSATEPAITLAQNGVVIWHSSAPTDLFARQVSLAPGESVSYPAHFDAVVCGVEDDAAESFRANLPAAPAGEYQVSAAMDFYGELLTDLVTGPAETITLK